MTETPAPQDADDARITHPGIVGGELVTTRGAVMALVQNGLVALGPEVDGHALFEVTELGQAYIAWLQRQRDQPPDEQA